MAGGEYRVIEQPAGSPGPGIELRGGAQQFWKNHDTEVMLSGPAETGKTFSCLHKVDALCWKYPGTQAVIIRKHYSTLHSSVIQTYTQKVAKMDVIRPYGGLKPSIFFYPNGSAIWLGGMDKPGKVLSSERDIIYVNQAEELSEGDWETLTTRATGRAGHMPYAQTLGDCNPGGSRHWILQRAHAGKLTLLKSLHIDNPALYSPSGALTPQGERSLASLQKLTGVRYQRLFLGLWVTAEGAVYANFNRDIHVRERPADQFQYWVMAQDEGYTHPAVILLIGIDADGRWHVAREFYQKGKLQAEVVAQAKAWALEKQIVVDAVDGAAAGLIADLRDQGVPALPCKGSILVGIRRIQDRLAVAGDGLPRLTVDPSCEETINEFESYVWQPGKDVPVKDMDHSMDAIRYLSEALDEPADSDDQLIYDERVDISPY